MSMSNAPLWYVSFRGGSKSANLNNIHVYTGDGKKVAPRKALNVDSLTQNVALRELRDLVIGPDGDLYLARRKNNRMRTTQMAHVTALQLPPAPPMQLAQQPAQVQLDRGNQEKHRLRPG